MSNGTYSFSESDYRFTNPVRYFTASDPYYWEVDNIPLKQLQENDLWLKGQIEDGFKNLRFSFGRSEFQELLPYSEGVDNVVRVKPGRFTARINSISESRLQHLERVAGEVFNQADRWKLATYENVDLKDTVDKITSILANDALFMNGLAERVFTYTVNSPYETFEADSGAWDGATGWQVLSPIFQSIVWPNAAWARGSSTADLGDGYRAQYADVSFGTSERGREQGLIGLWLIESTFIKYWKGVYRLAVVDVPGELSIEIPPFNQRDFDYYDENGNLQQNTTAETRIDLIFIYSKPVDASSVRVKTDNTTYRDITEPELGLVRGAGVVMRKAPIINDEVSKGETREVGDLDADGNVQILASPADQVNTNNGFKNLEVRGSFPAPDDIMNISPLLIEDLESSDPKLIGQSILPVAYVVVRRDANINENGETIISSEDIIDIRPLLRTSELSYNERAGIAAAVPQISISNPVVSRIEFKQMVDRVSDDYRDRIEDLRDSISQTNNNSNVPRVVGAGLVQGGFSYGPEAAIRNWWVVQDNITTTEGTQRWRERMNYPTAHQTPYFPEWDVAPWVPSTNRGEYPNDCVHVALQNFATRSGSYPYTSAKARRRESGGRLEASINDFLVFYCKKTIQLNKADVEWMDHYSVNVHYENCVPLTAPAFNNSTLEALWQNVGSSAKIFVETKKNEFTIYCSWVGAQFAAVSNLFNFTGQSPDNQMFTQYFGGTYARSNFTQVAENGLITLRDNPEVTAGHLVFNQEFSKIDDNGLQNVGICILPTVRFDVIGYPSRYSGMPRGLGGENPTINLA